MASDPTPTARVVVGIPGGEVVPEATATPSPSAMLAPSPTAPPAPTITPPSGTAVSPAPTPVPQPVAIPTTAPPSGPSQTPSPSPRPSGEVVAEAGPADSVVAFYRDVEGGQFDEAYALWSDRMKAAYPRTENLDERFDQTASVTFTELEVVQQDSATATVQANFVEAYESGGSREFIGYWVLVRTTSGWLLDEPHY